MSKKFATFTVSSLLLVLLLGACADSTATPAITTGTTSNAPTATLATTTAPTTQGVAISTTTAVATTVIPNTIIPASAPTTVATTGSTPATAAGSAVTAAWARQGVCYEVFVRSFFDSNGDGKGDLLGLIAKLDYLNDGNPNSGKSLGVNCIWLMPIDQSPSYHGYDTIDYYKVNPEYGTNDDFKKLTQEAHKRGIYVITDLVLNHTSIQSPWFQEAAKNPQSPYRDWYIFSPTDPGYPGPLGKAWHKNPYGNDYYYAVFGADLPDLNYRNPAVTKQIYDLTRYWLQDMGADGFRLDAVKHLIEDGQKQLDTPETYAWWRDFQKYLTTVKPDAFTIGEVSSGSSLKGYYPDQLNDYFEFSLAQGVVNSAKQGTSSFVNLAKDTYQNWPAQRWGTFLTNHDQNRVMDVLNSKIGRMQVAASAYLTLPGLPFIYYGEEIGMLGVKPDEKIRTPMQWSGDSDKGGFSTGQPWEALNPDVRTVNVQSQEANPNSLLNLYRNLIKVRRVNPALAQGDFSAVTAKFGVAAYLRQSGENSVLVVINMSDEEVKDLQLSVESSGLAAGQYTTTTLLSVNNPGAAFAPLKVGANGAIADYAPLTALPAYSVYIIQLKK